MTFCEILSILLSYNEINIDGGSVSTVTISPKYQIVIPKEIRKSMDLKPGEKVKLIQYDSRIEIILVKDIKKIKGFIKGMDTTVERESDRL